MKWTEEQKTTNHKAYKTARGKHFRVYLSERTTHKKKLLQNEKRTQTFYLVFSHTFCCWCRFLFLVLPLSCWLFSFCCFLPSKSKYVLQVKSSNGFYIVYAHYYVWWKDGSHQAATTIWNVCAFCNKKTQVKWNEKWGPECKCGNGNTMQTKNKKKWKIPTHS